MLFVLPFLVMAIAFLSGYFSLESLQSVQVNWKRCWVGSSAKRVAGW